jgi:hypothetical protein
LDVPKAVLNTNFKTKLVALGGISTQNIETPTVSF